MLTTNFITIKLPYSTYSKPSLIYAIHQITINSPSNHHIPNFPSIPNIPHISYIPHIISLSIYLSIHPSIYLHIYIYICIQQLQVVVSTPPPARRFRPILHAVPMQQPERREKALPAMGIPRRKIRNTQHIETFGYVMPDAILYLDFYIDSYCTVEQI